MDNEIIKQGAYYLLRGGTLLSEPCKKCGNLQIKYKDDIICMKCQYSDQLPSQHNITKIEDKDHEGNSIVNDANELKVKAELYSDIDTNTALVQLETKLIQDVLKISKKINSTISHKYCIRNLKVLNEYLKVINKLRKINQK